MSGERNGLVDFDRVNAAALRNADAVLRGLLPDGRREGAEWVACNPRRPDRKPGSFKINLNTGKWGDFATPDKGGDLVSLPIIRNHALRIYWALTDRLKDTRKAPRDWRWVGNRSPLAPPEG